MKVEVKPKKWYDSNMIRVSVLIMVTIICDYIVIHPGLLGSRIDPETRNLIMEFITFIGFIAGAVLVQLRRLTNQPIEGAPGDEPVPVKPKEERRVLPK